jgi:Predicted membrane protein
MQMVNAYLNVVKNNYFQFHGRMARAEFWWFTLMNFLIALALSFIVLLLSAMKNTDLALAIIGIYYLALLLPSLGAQIRRLHDIGMSGWWILINLVPYIGAIALLIMLILPSKPSGEVYGPYHDSMS